MCSSVLPLPGRRQHSRTQAHAFDRSDWLCASKALACGHLRLLEQTGTHVLGLEPPSSLIDYGMQDIKAIVVELPTPHMYMYIIGGCPLYTSMIL